MDELNKLYESIDKKNGDESAKLELKRQMKEYVEEIKTTGDTEKLKAVVVLLQNFIEKENEIKKLSIETIFAQKKKTIGELFNLKTGYEAKRNEGENAKKITFKEYVEKNGFKNENINGYCDYKNVLIYAKNIDNNNYELAILVKDPDGVASINGINSNLKTNNYTYKGNDFSISYTSNNGIQKNILLGDMKVGDVSLINKNNYVTKISVFKE